MSELVSISQITRAWLSANGINESVGFIKYLVRLNFIDFAELRTSTTFRRICFYSADTIKSYLAFSRSHFTNEGSYYEVLRKLYKAGLADRYAVHSKLFYGTLVN